MRQLCAQLHTALIFPRAAFGCTAGAVYSILSFITEKAFSVIGGDKGNASFFGRAAFTPYMVFGIEGI